MTVSLNSLENASNPLQKKKKPIITVSFLHVMPFWFIYNGHGIDNCLEWDSHDYAEHWFFNWNCPYFLLFIWSCKALKLWVSNKPNENWNRLGCLDHELFIWPFLIILVDIFTSICSTKTGIWYDVLTVYKFNITGHFAGMTGLRRRIFEQDTSCGQWLLMV